MGGKKKNRNHGGKAIHEASPGRISKARALLEEYNISATGSLPREVLKKKAQPLYTEKDIALLEKHHIQTIDYRDEKDIVP